MKTQHDGALADLFLATARDIYDAEKQILKALPKLARAAKSHELQEAFRHHREQTEDQIHRLEQVFEMLGERGTGHPCEAIRGIIEEGEETIAEFQGTAALDAGLIAAAQAVEHYEINRYDALKRWAANLGLDEAADLLAQSLAEEEETDTHLTELAEAGSNDKARSAGSDSSGKPSARSLQRTPAVTASTAGAEKSART